MTRNRRSAANPLLVALGAMLVSPVPAADESAAAFFQGKQVRFYTMGSPGGGYDTYMRALVPHLEKKLGAKMLPTNEPGAGGLIAMNRTLNAPPDGLTIVLIGGEMLVTAQLYEVAGGQLRRPQARLAGAGEQRVEGRAARAEVAIQRRRRHGEERNAGDLGRLRQDRRQFRFHRPHGRRARHEEQDHHRLQGHRRHEPGDPARRGGRPRRVRGSRRALRSEHRHAGGRDAGAQAGRRSSPMCRPCSRRRRSARRRRA